MNERVEVVCTEMTADSSKESVDSDYCVTYVLENQALGHLTELEVGN